VLSGPTASLHLCAGREFRDGERRVLHLLQGLVERGHRVLLCGPRTSALFARARAAALPCEALTLRSSHDFPSVVRLARLVRDQRFDLVHAHDLPSAQVARAARDLSGTPALLANLFITQCDLTNGAATLARVQYAAPGVHYIANCKPVRDALVQHGADAARIAIVPDGVDVPALRRARSNGGDPWGLGARGLRVIGTGAPLGRERSLTPVLDAFAIVHRRFPDTHLLVSGEAAGRGALPKQSRDLGLGAFVTFAGAIEDAAVVYGSMHAFVLASDAEGANTSLFEAMAAGTPVVVTAAPSILGLVRHGTSALVVPPRDPQALAQALGLVLQQPELAARLVQGANSIADMHSLDRMVDATLAAYHQLGQIDHAAPDALHP